MSEDDSSAAERPLDQIARAIFLQLAERCEREKPNWGLSVAIEIAIVPVVVAPISCNPFRVRRETDDYCYNPPDYCSSLDAAQMLLPADDANQLVFWRLGNDGEGGNPADFKAEVMVAGLCASHTHKAVAETPAMALCAAALRARTALNEKETST